MLFCLEQLEACSWLHWEIRRAERKGCWWNHLHQW